MKVRGSRRAAGLQPSDYDHEITLIDGEQADVLRPVSSEGSGLIITTTTQHLLSDDDDGGENDDGSQPRQSTSEHQRQLDEPSGVPAIAAEDHANGKHVLLYAPDTTGQMSLAEGSTRPSIEVSAPSPDEDDQSERNVDHQAYRARPKRTRAKRETAIDILYENERGGFLCGIAFFSGAALGGLDPTPWSNAYHNPSPTDIHTAQVPDPTWEWVWPEWRINHEDELDEGGWEYSFAFQKKFSWHGPKWWNSFVRRRAWIRRRAKKRPEDISTDPHVLNPGNYFTVPSASVISNRTSGSIACSRVPSRASLTQASSGDASLGRADIDDMETLLNVMRSARIDREKREAVENYLEHAIDLTELQHEMHEIMSLFVFQQSRRQLLTFLMQQHDKTTEEYEKDKSLELKLRKEALDAAVRHAEEEVCKLAYWSDVKQMAENGELRDVVDSCDGWQGLDKSAPAPPSSGKLPER